MFIKNILNIILLQSKNPSLSNQITYLQYSSEELKKIVEYLNKIKNNQKFLDTNFPQIKDNYLFLHKEISFFNRVNLEAKFDSYKKALGMI